MDSNETPLERAQKRLLDCENLEANQTAHVADLKRRGLDTKKDEEVLAIMKKITGFMREDVIIEQQRAVAKTEGPGTSIS